MEAQDLGTLSPQPTRMAPHLRIAYPLIRPIAGYIYPVTLHIPTYSAYSRLANATDFHLLL